MALSNIFREPRREITESIAGIVVLALCIIPVHLFATWFRDVVSAKDPGQRLFVMVVGYLLAGAAVFVLCVLAFATHALGESICDALAKRGLELRPRERR